MAAISNMAAFYNNNNNIAHRKPEDNRQTQMKQQEGNSNLVNHFIAGRAGLQMALPVQRTELHVSAEIHHFN